MAPEGEGRNGGETIGHKEAPAGPGQGDPQGVGDPLNLPQAAGMWVGRSGGMASRQGVGGSGGMASQQGQAA